QPQTSSQPWICVGEKDIVSSISNDVRSLKLSKEFKEKLCQPWSNTVVIRLLGKSIGYSYLCNCLRSMWKPLGNMHMIDVDMDCFLVRFGADKDYLKALTGGPWMPIQLYHKEVLISLDNLVGKTIKIDYNTQSAERGKFARIAVEIDLSEALVPGIDLDGAWQRIEYENLPNLCFECGKVGHLLDSCPTSSAPCGMEGLVVFGT
ncbi:hypothetical protein LINPERHAP2_LOCUS16931, partial [Linum perenne]